MGLGTGATVIMLIFFLHSAIYIGESTMNLGTGENHTITKKYLEDYAKLNITTSGNETIDIIAEEQESDDYNLTSSSGIVGGLVSFFNPLAPIWGFMDFIWGIISAPVTLYSLPIPWEIKLMFLAPLGLLYLVAIISFIRGFGL